jgi:hypothetical protein
MTRFKIVLINTVIVLGSLLIAVLQGQEAFKNSGFGSGGYNQGLTGTVMLAVVMAGIPIVVFAAAAYVALSHVLFRDGELDAYRKLRIIESVGAKDRMTDQPASRDDAAHNSLN